MNRSKIIRKRHFGKWWWSGHDTLVFKYWKEEELVITSGSYREADFGFLIEIFLITRAVQKWNGMPLKAVNSLSLGDVSIFKWQLNAHFSEMLPSMSWIRLSPPFLSTLPFSG